MNTKDKILLSDLNLLEYTREMTRWHPAGEILEQGNLLLTKGACPFPTACTAMTIQPAGDTEAAGLFDRIRSFYQDRKTPFSIHLRGNEDKALEDICLVKKLLQISDAPGMVRDKPFAAKPHPRNVSIRHADNIEDLADFVSVTKESYQTLRMPVAVTEQIFAVPERLLCPQNDWVVAYADGKPVSAAMTMLSHGVAGLYWVGTLESERGKGYAEACVGEAVNEAFHRGAALMVLQASKFGAPLYERMGFEEVTRYRWYMGFKPG